MTSSLFDLDIPYLLCSVLCFIPAMVFHEVSHGFAAYKLGDPTAKSQGRLSANPLKHIDPFGTVILPVCLMAVGLPVFGYAKPVPYNPFYFKDKRKGDLIVGLAGPAANLVMALLGAALYQAIIFGITAMPATQAQALLNNQVIYYAIALLLPLFVYVNLIFLFFNIIPIPPLDGSSVLAVLLPPKYMPQYYKVQQWALPIFMICVILLPQVIGFNPIGWYLNVTAGSLFNVLVP